jgi:hypothetical protein
LAAWPATASVLMFTLRRSASNGTSCHVLTCMCGATYEAVQERLRLNEQRSARNNRDPEATLLRGGVDRALAAIERQQRNLVDQLAEVSGGVAAIVSQKLEALEMRRQQLADDCEVVLARRTSWEAARAQVRELETWCRAVADRLSSFRYREKRLALDALGVQVQVWRTDHAPRWTAKARIPLGGPGQPIAAGTSGLNGEIGHFAAGTCPGRGRCCTWGGSTCRCVCRRGRAGRCSPASNGAATSP